MTCIAGSAPLRGASCVDPTHERHGVRAPGNETSANGRRRNLPRRRNRGRRDAAGRVDPDLHRHHPALHGSMTLGGADELSGYALAISSAWGFSSALLSRSHIRIDTVYVRIQSSACGRCSTSSALPSSASSAWSPGTPGVSSGSPGCRFALAVGHRGAAGDPAGPVVRGPAVLRRPVAAAAGARPAAFLPATTRPVRPDRLEVGAGRGRGGDRRVEHGLEQEKKQ